MSGRLLIVIVDDDHLFADGLAEHLRDDGHEARVFSAPSTLPPLPDLQGVSLLVTDYQMPGEDGLRLAERFNAAHPDVPIVITTAFLSEHLEGEAAARGFVHLVPKPLNYGSFRNLVQRILSET